MEFAKLSQLAAQFNLYGDLLEARPFGSGHINDTYLLVYHQAGTKVHYILQRINHAIFKDPAGLTANILKVTGHIRAKLQAAGEKDVSRKVMTLVPALDGKYFYQDSEGNFWRAMLFIEKTRSYDVFNQPEQAYEASKAFGRFQKLLADFPAAELVETIPSFHDTPKRVKDFLNLLEEDKCKRSASAELEIDFILENLGIASLLMEPHLKGEIPLRVTHNDTKFNNVMLDVETGKGLCVIDLDTVMPGLALYDFGDMVRTGTTFTAEDEKNLSRVYLHTDMFRGLVEGYLSEAKGFLKPAEIDRLVDAGKVITFEQAVRFLGDYLAGDVYYKTCRPEQNLDRARTQIKLVQSILEQENELLNIAKAYR